MSRRTTTRRRKGSSPSPRFNAGTVVFVILVIVGLILGGAFVLSKWQAAEPPQQQGETQTDVPETPQPTEEETDVDALLAEMTLEEKVYQMLFVTPESITGVGQVVAAGETTKAAIEKYPVGGIIYFAQNLQNREQTMTMLKNSQSYAKIPMFLGVDEEGGRVARVASNPDMGVDTLPPMLEIGEAGDTDAAYDVGKTLAQELSALGFNVDFAPVADILVNPNNTEIGDRAFGNDAQTVAEMVEQVVYGLQENGVSAVLKHFPGHGSTSVDSHTGYSASTRTLDELRESEFLPFQAGINADADFVMISHMTLVNEVEESVPASLSKEVITDWLIEEIGFDGIVITDSLHMGAITEHYPQSEAVVMAIHAGVDMILMPQSVYTAHTAIVDAVESGEISEDRIDESVRKILRCKEKMGMFE